MALGGIRQLWRLASASTGGASWWMFCYQRGLPRLVLSDQRIIYGPGVAGAVLQTPPLLIKSIIN